MLRLTSLCLLLLALLLAIGCDQSGIHPIGQILDITPNCDPLTDADNTTWMRTMVNASDEPIGTELVVFGFDPNAPPMPNTVAHCMQRIKIFGSTTTEEHLGIVNLTAPGTGTHVEAVHCDFPIEPGRPIFATGATLRRGARCVDLNFRGTVSTDFTFTMAAGNILEITWPTDEVAPIEEDYLPNSTELRAPEMAERVLAGTYRYMEVGDLLSSLTPELDNATGATGVFQIFNIALLASQARLAGFGSSGMTQYLNSTSHFNGLISSDYSVNVENFSMPRTTIHYAQFEDLTGLIIGSAAGDDQITVVNTNGNGGMTGALDYFLLRDRSNPSSAITGNLDYIDVQIISGFGAGGVYHLYIDESAMTFDLDVDALIGYDDTLPGYGNFDLSPILPPTL